MPSVQYLLFSIIMFLFLGAVVLFVHFVIRPMRIAWAIIEAKKLIAKRRIDNSWRCRNVCRTLATARNDLEAVDLWHQLQDIRAVKENWA